MEDDGGTAAGVYQEISDSAVGTVCEGLELAAGAGGGFGVMKYFDYVTESIDMACDFIKKIQAENERLQAENERLKGEIEKLKVRDEFISQLVIDAEIEFVFNKKEDE
ncbi:hypothetical protein [Bacillus sp. FSL W8-0940]|uniref:hypothetical protein n=1 Tax=Bacillus sp. FSL W8-0940 TaxID=2954638 RepID=UPI0030FC584A